MHLWILLLSFIVGVILGGFILANQNASSKLLTKNFVNMVGCQQTTYPMLSGKLDGCGAWREKYMDLHRGILSGSLPPRYLVSIAVEAGLADRVIGILTEFYFAVLTNRAFQITTYGTLPRFEAAFNAPYINWSRLMDPPEVTDNLKYTYRGLRGYQGNRLYGPDVNTSLYWPMYLVNDEISNRFFSSANVSTFPQGHADVQTVFVASNRGRIIQLFDNPYHRGQLFEMGLRPETALSCAWNFLFSPNDAVQHAMTTEFAALRSSSMLKITINIRVGDHVFDPVADENTTLEPYELYFSCAESIEYFARTPNRSVIWYVTSDSLRLRQLAKRRFGNKVLTQENMHYAHGDCGHSQEKSYGGCTTTSQDLSIQIASGQLWAMSMCDYHVVSQHSGFGRLAGIISGRWHNIFSIDGSQSNCSPGSYTLLEAMATKYAGV